MLPNQITPKSIGNEVTARCGIVCNDAAVYVHVGPMSTSMDPEAARHLAFALLTAADEADRHERCKRGAA